MTVDAFARALRARTISSAEMVDECLRLIEAGNPRLNAFILVMGDEARRDAREADRELAEGRDRGPLHGVPISIKDLFDVRGTATTAASHVREGHVADADAAAIVRLRQAGAVIIGKTNLHEFAFGTTNEDSAFGPARHPHDPAFGPVLMFGLGGVMVEVLKDVAFRIVPLSSRDAAEIIRDIRGLPLLQGYRGAPPVDLQALERVLLTLSAFVAATPEVKEIDVNPLYAYPDGALAVDARMILEEVTSA